MVQDTWRVALKSDLTGVMSVLPPGGSMIVRTLMLVCWFDLKAVKHNKKCAAAFLLGVSPVHTRSLMYVVC